ncbi:hypothetical protein CKO44_22025 [Rubrivivax gelatinosus]|uniref:PAAR domain-containing protein n=1 Tax=Rubrivivax gelatinosus TaxID=28068 RepID=UPI001905E278|nr:PAAR domain-containing protein [Rubrivivax gelatinosus]MBK1616137.1 hypothetical protein [Rubrivivax gelatinosus]MBZ8143128.1 hypothetical protein [Rubrivivax gelatinosus]
MPAMIVMGDKTDHGGEVIECSEITDTHGRRIARVGDKVRCPKKGHGITVIVTGDDTMLIDGKAVAYHGCRTSCGATLLSSQTATTVELDGAVGVSAVTHAVAAASGQAAIESVKRSLFDLRFLLKDEMTGRPVVSMSYRITLESGEEFIGKSDSDGLTQLVGSDTRCAANIEAPYYGDISSDSYPCDGHSPCCC